MNTGTSRNSIAPGNGRRIVRGLSGTQVAEKRRARNPAQPLDEKARVRCRGKPSIEDVLSRMLVKCGDIELVALELMGPFRLETFLEVTPTFS